MSDIFDTSDVLFVEAATAAAERTQNTDICAAKRLFSAPNPPKPCFHAESSPNEEAAAATLRCPAPTNACTQRRFEHCIDADVRQMDAAYGVAFHRWIRDPAHLQLAAPHLARLVSAHAPATSAAVLAWVVAAWPLKAAAELLLRALTATPTRSIAHPATGAVCGRVLGRITSHAHRCELFAAVVAYESAANAGAFCRYFCERLVCDLTVSAAALPFSTQKSAPIGEESDVCSVEDVASMLRHTAAKLRWDAAFWRAFLAAFVCVTEAAFPRARRQSRLSSERLLVASQRTAIVQNDDDEEARRFVAVWRTFVNETQPFVQRAAS